eukprot:648378-Hanusia_phi.AAC.1
MAAKRGRGGRAGAAAAAAGTPATSLGVERDSEIQRDPGLDKREARLAREAETRDKVNENSVEREARLARDRARKAKKTAAETSADREARLQKEAQNRASKKRQRLQDAMAVSRSGLGKVAAGRQMSRASTPLQRRRRGA